MTAVLVWEWCVLTIYKRCRLEDPATNALQWGSEHGPLRFERVASFENEVTAEWAHLSNHKGEESEQIG